MKTRVFLFFVFVLTTVAFATWLTLLVETSPSSRDVVIAFYLASLGTFAGGIFGIGYLANFWPKRLAPSWAQTVRLLRISCLMAVVLVTLLALQASHLLTVVWALVLIISSIIIELVWRRRTSQTFS